MKKTFTILFSTCLQGTSVYALFKEGSVSSAPEASAVLDLADNSVSIFV